MQQNKQYIAPATSVFALQPMDKLMWPLEPTGGPQPGSGAPYRF